MSTKTNTPLLLAGSEGLPAKERRAPRKNTAAEIMGNWVDGLLVLNETQTKNFWDKVQKSDGCWNWTGCRRRLYGSFQFSFNKIKRHIPSHRVAYAMFKGAIPRGLLICHTCDNPSCVNPDHLFLGTNMDNMLDKMRKGRSNRQKGISHGMAKLNNEQVLQIRKRYAGGMISQTALGNEFGVIQQTISLIVRRKHWPHI